MTRASRRPDYALDLNRWYAEKQHNGALGDTSDSADEETLIEALHLAQHPVIVLHPLSPRSLAAAEKGVPFALLEDDITVPAFIEYSVQLLTATHDLPIDLATEKEVSLAVCSIQIVAVP